MSGQDVNPFADPADINPFAETSQSPTTTAPKNDMSNDFNPFAVQQDAIPSQKQATTPSPPVTTNAQSAFTPISTTAYQPSSPATLETTKYEPPAPVKKQQPPAFKGYGTSNDPMRERQEELERKSAELDRKEAELNKRAAHGDGNKNFPPLPKFCCFGPCYYHDISMEIPIDHQRTCKMVFYSWELYVLAIVFNTVTSLAGLCVGADDGAVLFGVSILYLVLFPPLSFVAWYRPLYKALRGNSSFNFMMFFFVYFFQTIFMFLYALGISSFGTCGWINGAQVTKVNHAVSAMYFISAALFTALTLIYVYLLRRDPSVTSQTTQQKQGADDYNPFSGQQQNYSTPQQPPPYTQQSAPATIEPEVAPTYQAQPFGGASTAAVAQDDSMRQRQAELEKKAAELDRKEQELKVQQKSLPKENNFPPFPKFCPVSACFYHDISAEIPIQSQRTCKMVFYLWQLYVLTLLFNFISALALLCDGGSGGGVTFGVSILYLVLFPPMSFLFWYRPLYKALRSDSSFNYFIFFFIFFFQILFSILYAIGISGFGTCGWINGANHADAGHAAVSAMMFVCAALFTLLSILEIFLLRKVHAFYRASGASLEKAQSEFATGVATNKDVQNAAVAAVKAGVNTNAQGY